jgi:hypothetical protein
MPAIVSRSLLLPAVIAAVLRAAAVPALAADPPVAGPPSAAAPAPHPRIPDGA